jgi:ankyrin repeat protein
MDVVAQVRNTVNRSGGIYSWDYRGRDDDFTRAFQDKLVNINGYVRIVDGDNRPIPTRDAFTPADTAGWTALHFAAARGNADEVRTLLARGERVDVQSAKGRTPLYETAKRGRLSVVQLLLDGGAAVNAKEREGGSLRFMSLRSGSILR